ncbi:MAG: hypothetical protein HN348_32110 [Proteobacteria bacterium]|nr:hypothetical protein [Pseudomonadota bacterium]
MGGTHCLFPWMTEKSITEPITIVWWRVFDARGLQQLELDFPDYVPEDVLDCLEEVLWMVGGPNLNIEDGVFAQSYTQVFEPVKEGWKWANTLEQDLANHQEQMLLLEAQEQLLNR